jgi:hypothetical protein
MTVTSDQICELTKAIKALTVEMQKIQYPPYVVNNGYPGQVLGQPMVVTGAFPGQIAPNAANYQITLGAPINTTEGNY